MIPTTSTTRRLAAAGLTTALVATALSGCAQEEATRDASTSTSAEAVPTTTDDDAASSAAPDDGPTTADAEQTTSGPTTEAAPTTLESADGSFEVEVPGGWEDAMDLLDEKGVLLAAKDTERVDDFFTNVVVTTEEPVDDLPEALARAAKKLAGEEGDYELLEAVDVDGEEAPGYTLVRDVKDTRVHQVQRWINREEALYVVTFSAVESQAEATAPVLEEILSSWSWGD